MKITKNGITYIVKKEVKVKKHFAKIADDCKKHRLNLGLTLLQASKKSKLSMASLSQIENGLMTPSLDALFRLAKTYKCIFRVG